MKHPLNMFIERQLASTKQERELIEQHYGQDDGIRWTFEAVFEMCWDYVIPEKEVIQNFFYNNLGKTSPKNVSKYILCKSQNTQSC